MSKNTLLIFGMTMLLVSCMKPVAKFSLLSEKHEAPATVMLKNESANADAYTWDFGDGTTAKDTATMHRFTHAGKYNVTLTAIKGNKTNTMTKSIESIRQANAQLKSPPIMA